MSGRAWRGWLTEAAPRPIAARLLAVYGAGAVMLLAGYLSGLLGPVLRTAGWVGPAVGVLATAHVVLALRTVARLRVGSSARTIALGQHLPLDLMRPGGAFACSDLTPVLVAAARARVEWLSKLDATILTVGFLGKLGAIAAVTGGLQATDAAGAVAGLGRLTQGISAALFATMLGLGVAAWTHCATLVVSNHVEQA